MSEQPSSSLYRKLAAVAGAIASVEKDGKNKDQGYRYATPAGVMAAIKPHLAEHKLALVPHLVEFSEIDTGMRSGNGKPFVMNRVTMHYHLLDGESGESMVVPWQGQAGTYGDDKGLAKAQTIALRTFLIQLFQIPAEDPEHDPDHADARAPVRQEAPRRAARAAEYVPAPEPTPQPAKKAPTPEGARKRFFEHWGATIGGETWEHAQRWLGTPKAPQPETVEGWKGAHEFMQTAHAARQAEYNQIENAA
jgi:hypothetical protein